MNLEGFQVMPITWSPFLRTISSEMPPASLSMKTPCERCNHVGSVGIFLAALEDPPVDALLPIRKTIRDCMLNLGDNRVFCGRHANGCMLTHCGVDGGAASSTDSAGSISSGSACPIVVSFLDLSVWDYSQVRPTNNHYGQLERTLT
jgi:hypothetical protein